MDFNGEILFHCRRTAGYASAIAKNSTLITREYALADKTEVRQAIYDAGYLHDFGQIMHSEHLLNSKENMNLAEKKGIEHPVSIVEILACIKGFSEQSAVYQTIVKNACLYHHEKCDGSGYPYGLRKKYIPLEARIISVADVLDGLISERSNKHVWSFDDLIEYLNKMLIVWHEDELRDAFQCAYDELKYVYKATLRIEIEEKQMSNSTKQQKRKRDDPIRADTLTSSEKLRAISLAANEVGMSYGKCSSLLNDAEKEIIYKDFAERLERQRLQGIEFNKNQRMKRE